MRPPTRFASAPGWVESINSWKRGRADVAGAIAAPTASQSWSNLDSRGNWVAWNDGTGSQTRVHSGANEIQSIQVGSATTPLQWDGAGNRLADGTSAFAWNIRGLMDTVKRDGAVLGTYGYDALGRRNLKVAGGRRTVFVYDGWQCVWQKVTGSGTDTTKAFVYANYIDEPVNMVRKWGSSTDTLWYMQGNNFNVEALTDRTGAIVERYEYTPYGKVTIFTGAGPDGKWLTADDVVSSTSARGNSLTFQGRELDVETGLYYFRARYYSTWLGRFMSRDPIRLGGGDHNIYRFVFDNPLRFQDPTGFVTTNLQISPKTSVSFIPLNQISGGRPNASGRGMTVMTASADCKCSGNCEDKYSMACTLNASIRIYLAELTDPIWMDPSLDSRYGNKSHTVMSRINDVLNHESDHFKDFGWQTRWFINRLWNEESAKFDELSQCEARASFIPGKIGHYVRKMNTVSARFDSTETNMGNQWESLGPPPEFGNSW